MSKLKQHGCCSLEGGSGARLRLKNVVCTQASPLSKLNPHRRGSSEGQGQAEALGAARGSQGARQGRRRRKAKKQAAAAAARKIRFVHVRLNRMALRVTFQVRVQHTCILAWQTRGSVASLQCMLQLHQQQADSDTTTLLQTASSAVLHTWPCSRHNCLHARAQACVVG